MAITERDVHSAADSLLIQGERPTIERVRLKLGRGSPNTITGFLNTWFAQLGPRLTGQGREEVPDAVLAAAQNLWQTARKVAQAHARTESEAQEAQLAQEREALAARAKALEEGKARLIAREADLQLALTALREQLTAMQAQVVRLTEHSKAADAARMQAEEAGQAARQDAEALRGQLLRQQAEQAETLREAHHRHAAQERRWLTELDAERQQNKKLQTDLERARQGAERERTDAQAAQVKAAEQLRAAERTEAALRTELEAARIRLETHKQAAQREAQAAEKRESERAQQVRELTAQLAAKEKQLDAVVGAVSKRRVSRRGASAPNP